MVHDTVDEMKEYLKEHPHADSANHTVEDGGNKRTKKKDDGQKSVGGLRDKLKSFLSNVKGIHKSVVEAVQKAPEHVQQIVVDPRARKEAFKTIGEGIKKSPERVTKLVLDSARKELHELKHAVHATKKLVKKPPEKLTKQDKAALYAAGIYAAGMALSLVPPGNAIVAAGAFGKSFVSHVGIKAVHQILDKGFLHFEAAETARHTIHTVTHFLDHIASEEEGDDAALEETLIHYLVAAISKMVKDADMESILQGDKEPDISSDDSGDSSDKKASLHIANSAFLEDALREFADIIDLHEDHLKDAEMFGLRTAAYPKGLMPLKEAQQVVASLQKDSESLQKFFRALVMAGSDVPGEIGKDYAALITKTKRQVEKFSVDLKRAQEALARHEDILVGGNFQEMFQEVRMAILDLRLSDNVDIDFTTQLYLDKDPAFATGTITLSAPSPKLNVTVGYRAADDFYWCSIRDAGNYATYNEIVKKSGHAFLPRFVRDIADRVLALGRVYSPPIFESKKRDLPLVSPEFVVSGIRKPLEEKLKQFDVTHLDPPSSDFNLFIKFTTDSAGMATLTKSRLPRLAVGNFHAAQVTVSRCNAAFDKFNKPFNFDALGHTWTAKVRPFVPKYWIAAGIANAQLTTLNEKNFSKALADSQAYSRSIQPGIFIEAAYHPQRIFALEMDISRSDKPSKARVAARYIQAGSRDFSVYVESKDVNRAFNEAVDAAGDRYGHKGYTGTIAEKRGYGFKVRTHTPMTKAQAQEYIDRDIERADKWGEAFAIPVSEERVLGQDKVTVSVDEKSESAALRMGILRIKATGRVPPGANIQVVDAVVKKVGAKYDVTGIRKQVITGDISGWYFYGHAPS